MARKITSFLFMASLLCAPAFARRANDVTITYFADAGMKTEVGSVEYTCGGGIVKIGRVTGVHRSDSDSCANGRMTPIALQKLARSRDKVAECQFMCTKKYKIGLCTPDSCAWHDALDECEKNCDELGAPPANQ